VDEAARLALIETHLHLVQALARQVHTDVCDRLELDDLVAYGHHGLCDAARRFDPGQGVSFATYAWHRVRGAMLDGLREMTEVDEELPDDVAELPDLGERADDLAAAADERRRLFRVLATLPDKERHFVEKHYFEDKTLIDAGRELGLSRSWASRLHARAVSRLRELIDFW
jgi:RNA polymerase sigma factor for flagellar operon FliA